MYKTHITPSGAERTLCGRDASDVESTSLGMTCTCIECTKIAQNILDTQLTKRRYLK